MSVLWFRTSTCWQFWQKRLTQNFTQIILYYHVTKYFFLAWIDWSRASNFRICFEKILVGFDFDLKLTQNVAQITMYCHVSKEFLRLHFVVDQVLSISGYDLKNRRMLSISGYDLKNRRMLCKQKYWIKNMTVKILILIFFLPLFPLLTYLGPCRWFQLVLNDFC